MWDVFISHASEDKENFVKPLAETLRKYGVKVWYDEFELKIGDSLSESIDKGLIESNYGIIVLSPKFFEKKWIDYELKSLISKQINGKRVILPLWYGISKNEIQKHSLYLSDIISLTTEESIDKIIEKIIQVVRPDILNSQLLLKIGVEMYKSRANMEIREIPVEKLIESPVRHKTLPTYMVIARYNKSMCRIKESGLLRKKYSSGCSAFFSLFHQYIKS